MCIACFIGPTIRCFTHGQPFMYCFICIGLNKGSVGGIGAILMPSWNMRVLCSVEQNFLYILYVVCCVLLLSVIVQTCLAFGDSLSSLF